MIEVKRKRYTPAKLKNQMTLRSSMKNKFIEEINVAPYPRVDVNSFIHEGGR